MIAIAFGTKVSGPSRLEGQELPGRVADFSLLPAWRWRSLSWRASQTAARDRYHWWSDAVLRLWQSLRLKIDPKPCIIWGPKNLKP